MLLKFLFSYAYYNVLFGDCQAGACIGRGSLLHSKVSHISTSRDLIFLISHGLYSIICSRMKQSRRYFLPSQWQREFEWVSGDRKRKNRQEREKERERVIFRGKGHSQRSYK